MMRALYSLVMRAAQPLLARKLQRRGQAEPGYLEAVGERFGRYDAPAPAPGALWIHAVSLGETRAAEVLLRALRERRRRQLQAATVPVSSGGIAAPGRMGSTSAGVSR